MKTSLGRGAKKIRSPQRSGFAVKGFRGHVVCNVMFAHLPLRVREILTVEGPRRPPQPPSAFHSLARSAGHASQRPKRDSVPRANQRTPTQPSHSPRSPFRNGSFFFSFFFPLAALLKEGAGLSPLPHQPPPFHIILANRL